MAELQESGVEKLYLVASANAAAGFYGGWGGPPVVDLVTVGQEKHEILISVDDEGQGFSSSHKVLLISAGNSVSTAWSIEDEQDDAGAYNPTDKLNKQRLYRSSAAFKFIPSDSETGGSGDYYDIELMSRDANGEDFKHHLKPENRTEIYRFRDGKYRLLRHIDFVESRRVQKKSTR